MKFLKFLKETLFANFQVSLNDDINKYQKEKIVKTYVDKMFKTMLSLSIIIFFAMLFYFLDDLGCFGGENRFDSATISATHYTLNLIGEIIAFTASLGMIITTSICISKKVDNTLFKRAICLIYYILLFSGLTLFVVSKVIRKHGIENIDSSIVYMCFIVMTCPLFNRILDFLLIFAEIIVLIILRFTVTPLNEFNESGMWVVYNIVFLLIAIIVSSYMYGSNIKGIIKDVKLNELNEELNQKLEIDELTQVYNRRALKILLESKSAEWKDRRCNVTFIMADIDFFKNYNDTYGHLKGDDCLKRVAQATNLAVQQFSGKTYRYGGEEFLIVIPDAGSDIALQAAGEIHKEIAKLKIAHQASSVNENITVSMGVNVETEFRRNSQQWILDADTQLYVAKHEGRNCTSYANKIYKK